MEKIRAWFAFAERQTDFRTEIVAGMTTFFSMLYIVIVIPMMFSRGGMEFGGVYVATVFATMMATLTMGIAANYPIAVAPGVGVNAYLAYVVVVAGGMPWQEAMGAVLVASGVLMIFSLSSLGEMLLRAIPLSLKAAVTVGLGLFMAMLGLENGRLVVAAPITGVTLGDLSDPLAALTLLGLFLTLLLMMMGVRGAVFIGMFLTAAVSYAVGVMEVPAVPFSLPWGLEKTLGQFAFGDLGSLGMTAFTLFLVTLLDTTGTVLGVGRQAKLMTSKTFPRLKNALWAGSVGGLVGALAGTGPTTALAESGTGVAAGGRTGFTAVVTAILFGVLLFCAPLSRMMAEVPAITAPALILSGAFLMESVTDIDWKDYTEAFPAFFTLLLMPLSFSIATGIGVGFVLYVFLKAVAGKGQRVHPLLYALSILFVIQLVLRMP